MKKVLIVEDHWMTVENLVAVCKESGCEVKVAMSLFEAQDMVVEECFDIFVWDFNLPDGTTIEVIKVAKEKNPNAVMIASSSEEKNRDLQLKAGCDLSASPYSIYNVLEEEVNK